MSGVRSCVLKFLKRFWLTSLLTIKVDFQCLDPRIQKTYISVQTADLAMRTQGIRDTDLSDKRFSAQRLKVTPNVRLVSWVLHVQKSCSSECLQDWRDRAPTKDLESLIFSQTLWIFTCDEYSAFNCSRINAWSLSYETLLSRVRYLEIVVTQSWSKDQVPNSWKALNSLRI